MGKENKHPFPEFSPQPGEKTPAPRHFLARCQVNSHAQPSSHSLQTPPTAGQHLQSPGESTHRGRGRGGRQLLTDLNQFGEFVNM